MTEESFDTADLEEVIDKIDTQDGPGTDNLDSLPESDFVSFATDNVEIEETE